MSQINTLRLPYLISYYSSAFIPGETQDDPLRVAIDLPEFLRSRKEGHITDYSKAESTVRLATLRYFSTKFVIHFVAFHYDMTT